MPLISGSLTAARTPSSSARPIWCLVRGRITPPRRAIDTLVTLSRLIASLVCIACLAKLALFDGSLRSLRCSRGAAVFVESDETALFEEFPLFSTVSPASPADRRREHRGRGSRFVAACFGRQARCVGLLASARSHHWVGSGLCGLASGATE